MSINTEEATPSYLVSGDPRLADYYPAWLDNLMGLEPTTFRMAIVWVNRISA